MIAVDQLFGNYGHGDSWDAAVADLVLVLTEYYQLLHGADDTASREMFEDLQTYLERIE